MTANPSQTAALYTLRYACVCDRGLRRSANQDRAWADVDHRVFAVCDGVGGSQGGEIASQTAIETLQDAFHTPDSNPPLIRLQRAVHYANRDIYEMALREVHLAGMATTIVVLYLEGLTAYVGHAGDSRLYRFANGVLCQETHDHNEAQDAVRRGELTPEAALHMRGRNIINRALGIQPEVELETQSFPFEIGTRFLLCSDGITRHISNAELAELITGYTDPQMLCDILHERCYMRGAEDNLTALVVNVEAPGAAMVLPPQSRSSAGIAEGFETAPTLEPQQLAETSREYSGEFRRSREHSIPPRSFPPERAGGLHPLEERLAAHKAAIKRRLLAGGVLGVFLLLAAFWAGGQYYSSMLKLQDDASNPIKGDGTNDPKNFSQANLELYESGQRELTTNPQAAYGKFLKLVEREPARAEFRYYLGRAALATHRAPEAVTQLEMAVNLDPKLTEAYMYLAAARSVTGDVKGEENARKQFRELYLKQESR